MPFKVSWLEENKVILLEVSGKINPEENSRMNAELGNFIEAGNAPVHLIVELGADLSVPMDVSLLAKSPISNPKMGHAAMIGGNNVLRFMAKIVSQLTKAKAHMVDSREEAMSILRQADTSLV